MIRSDVRTDQIFFAGGCLWGVQEYCRYLPGVLHTEAGRANGLTLTTDGPYDGYAECVRVEFDTARQTLAGLLPMFFEIIDPYSVNQQGPDKGKKYRTGIYSRDEHHLEEATRYIQSRADRHKIVVEVLPLLNYVASDAEHQDRLLRCPEDSCHLDSELLYKYRT